MYGSFLSSMKNYTLLIGSPGQKLPECKPEKFAITIAVKLPLKSMVKLLEI